MHGMLLLKLGSPRAGYEAVVNQMHIFSLIANKEGDTQRQRNLTGLRTSFDQIQSANRPPPGLLEV